MEQAQLSKVNGSRAGAEVAGSNGNGHDSRIFELEREVGNLRVNNAALSTSVEHLAGAVETLNTTVQSLRDTMNQGRGALWFAMFVSGALGAAAMAFLKNFLKG